MRLLVEAITRIALVRHQWARSVLPLVTHELAENIASGAWITNTVNGLSPIACLQESVRPILEDLTRVISAATFSYASERLAVRLHLIHGCSHDHLPSPRDLVTVGVISTFGSFVGGLVMDHLLHATFQIRMRSQKLRCALLHAALRF